MVGVAEASSSTIRAVKHRVAPVLTSTSSRSVYTEPYTPRRDRNVETPSRPPRPSSPFFFTGRPQLASEIDTLEQVLISTQQSLRASYIYPLPRDLPSLQPPETRWKSAEEMAIYFNKELKTNGHRKVTTILNELNRIRYVAELGGKIDLANKVSEALEKFQKGVEMKSAEEKVGKGQRTSAIDEFGRAYGTGRRKEASASVWIIPSKHSGAYLDASADTTISKDETAPGSPLPITEILVNHLPLPMHFARPTDREAILRPLRLTGLLGAYNVFALTRGGGTTGQTGAIALALARALTVMRPDTKDVLFAGEYKHGRSRGCADYADGALMRDTRMTERKKTGQPKARKKVRLFCVVEIGLTCHSSLGSNVDLSYRYLYICMMVIPHFS